MTTLGAFAPVHCSVVWFLFHASLNVVFFYFFRKSSGGFSRTAVVCPVHALFSLQPVTAKKNKTFILNYPKTVAFFMSQKAVTLRRITIFMYHF